MRKLLGWFIALLIGVSVAYLLIPQFRSTVDRIDYRSREIAEIRAEITPRLWEEMDKHDLTLGDPVFLRIFKEEAVLELWIADADKDGHQLFRSYPICNYSGDLGPKLAEGDRQSPEGFYQVRKSALNPKSSYHLSFNLGFPNSYDRAHGRTGSYLMVHGDCLSIGCYAMTDAAIEEIYVIVEAALNNGQPSIPVHAFPFRMEAMRLAREEGNTWFGFWSNLKQGYDLFEASGKVPEVDVEGRDYVFEEGKG